jgi:hypothetical protein
MPQPCGGSVSCARETSVCPQAAFAEQCIRNRPGRTCPSTALKSPRRGRLFGWLAENLATALAQVSTLLAHARGNTFHTRNFRCTKPKNVTGAETALIVLRKCVTRCWQHCQTKSQTRCDPQITNCEQINWHIVSPELTDVAAATRRLAVLESSIMVSIRASTLQDSQPQVHRNFAPTTQLRSLIWNRRPSSRRPRRAFEGAGAGVSRRSQHSRSLR